MSTPNVANVQVKVQNAKLKAKPASKRRKQPNVTVLLGAAEETIPVGELLNPDTLSVWQQRLRDYEGAPYFQIRNLQSLKDGVRFELFSLIVSHPTHVVTIGRRRTDGLNLFDAILDAVKSGANVGMCECLRRAAVEAAVLSHPTALTFACARIAKKFREAGFSGLLPQSLVKQAHALLGDEESPIAAEEAAQEFINDVKNQVLRASPQEFDADALANGPGVAYYNAEFYLFLGTHWRNSPAAEFRARVAAMLQKADHGLQVSRKFVGDVIANVEGMALLPQIDQSLPLWLAPESPTGSPYISFQNGLINLTEALQGEARLYKHDPRHFSTAVLPYDFDPTASCPLWRNTLNEVFRDRPNRQLKSRRTLVLQEYFGYTLLPHNMQFEKCLVLFGDGANGKSTIMTTLTDLLGADNVSHVPIEKIGQEFWLARMIGMLANITADMNWVDRIAEGMFKAIVSGDRLDANRKNLPQIPMKPTAKLIFGTNTLPPFHDRSNGVWRRLILMPLCGSFYGKDRDVHRAKNLSQELSGIFNWALEGARRLMQRDRFTECEVCQAALDQHRFESDPVQQFLDECTVRDPEKAVFSRELYGAFREWCNFNGRRPCSSSEFGKQILALPGIGKGRESTGHRPHTYTGLVLLRPFIGRLSMSADSRF